MTAMATIEQFKQAVVQRSAIHYAYPNRVAELEAIASALENDTTTHDITIETPQAPVLRSGAADHSAFTNDILHLVNIGKAGNLTPADMAEAITDGLANFEAPVNIDAPAVTPTTASIGDNLTCTTGNWDGQPTDYDYQWRRDGLNIAGATSSVYALVGADEGASVSCNVTASNAGGTTSVQSNAVTVS